MLQFLFIASLALWPSSSLAGVLDVSTALENARFGDLSTMCEFFCDFDFGTFTIYRSLGKETPQYRFFCGLCNKKTTTTTPRTTTETTTPSTTTKTTTPSTTTETTTPSTTTETTTPSTTTETTTPSTTTETTTPSTSTETTTPSTTTETTTSTKSSAAEIASALATVTMPSVSG